MIVEILSAIDAGRQTLAAGVIVELQDDEAMRLVAAGLARKIGSEETAGAGTQDGSRAVHDATAKAKRKG